MRTRSPATRPRRGGRSPCGATPANPHDANAIAVDDADGAQLGWVPRELAAALAPDLDAGRPWSAVVLREQRGSPRDPRTGITMLLAAAPAVTLAPR